MNNFEVTLERYPDDDTWLICKHCALVTVGKTTINPPDMAWKQKILRARHSPIRVLQFLFCLRNVPYYVSNHLVRHVHAQPFVRSQRSNPDRGAERQDAPVDMFWYMNAEELMAIAEKRLCNKADPLTRQVVREMCRKVEAVCPEFAGLLGPMCCTTGYCREMTPCHNEPFCVDCKHVRMNDLGCPEYCSRFDEETDPVTTCAFWEASP